MRTWKWWWALGVCLSLMVPAAADNGRARLGRLIHDIDTGRVCVGSCWACMHGCTEAERVRLCCPPANGNPR